MESRTTEKNTLIFRIVGGIFLVLGIIFLAVTLQLWIKRLVPGMMTADTGGSYCTLEPIGSERLGDTCEGAQAEEGYTFYRLDFQVTNEGDETRYGDNYYGIYFNEDNGFIWWEDEFTCPKANHITYNNNPNIVVLFEKGNPDQPGDPGTISGEQIVKEANARLA